MQFILHLIQKHKTPLLFFVLEFIALFFTIQFHTYNKSKFINSANEISGGLYNSVSSFRSYLHLKSENELLNQENSSLKNFISSSGLYSKDFKDSTNHYQQKFKYTPSVIINNDFHKKNNYITLDKGKKHGIVPDVAIVNAKGIIGIVTNTSKNYASAISVLNTSFKTNACLKNNDYFGTLTWNGKSHDKVQLKNIPRQALLKIGDTVVTGGRSSIFPKGILIGSVCNISYHDNRHKQIDVKLFNDIKNVTQVYLIKNLHQNEIKSLENKRNE